MKEKWKPVRGYAGLYEVSSEGRVRSLPRRGLDKRLLKGKMLSTRGTGPGGRPRVCLYKKSSRKWKLLYRLVLESFVGYYGPHVDARHFPDRTVTNCKLNNLRWGTRSDNMQDAKIHGTLNSSRDSSGRYSWKRRKRS